MKRLASFGPKKDVTVKSKYYILFSGIVDAKKHMSRGKEELALKEKYTAVRP
jgi:hypothetical protein